MLRYSFILGLLLAVTPWLGRAEGPITAADSTVDSLQALRGSTGVTVAWRTTDERGLLGFELWLETVGGHWECVNAEPLSVVGGFLGHAYQLNVPGAAETIRCQLVLLDDNLRRRVLGPFTLAVSDASAPVLASTPVALALVTPAPASPRDWKSYLASGAAPQIKITTQAEGLHRLTAAALAPLLGVTPETVSGRIAQGDWALLHRGHPVGWLPGANGAELLFYAEALRNNYTEQNVYWLADGTNLPLATVDGGAPTAVSNGCYTASLAIEPDTYCRYELGMHPDSNYWFWAILKGGSALSGKLDSTFVLDALGPTNLTAQLTVRVQGATATNHTLTCAVNGTTNAAWVGAWSGKVPAAFTFEVPSALLRAGSNTFRFTALGTFSTQWWLAGWRLEYPRPLTAVGGQLLCGANSNAVLTLTGFTNAALTLLEVTSPLTPRLVTNLTSEPMGGRWQASYVPSSPNTRYVACQSGAAHEVVALEAVWPVGLVTPTNRAACLLIAPPALLAAAQPLADYRNRQGLETKLLSLETVYNEFNYGLREPEAIRTLLAYAWNHWEVKPAYALLIGNGTYDYRNLRGLGDNLVPPLMVPTLFGLAASDSSYGDVAPAPGPEIAVGRLPVVNAAQLGRLLTKIQAYEAAPPRTVGDALLMADIPGAAGDFVADLQEVQFTLGNTYTQRVILPGDTGNNTAIMRSLLLSNLNLGADLFCYLGHGADDRLGNAGYLTSTDVPTLTNTSHLPLVSAITCLAGFFAEPGYNCLSETLVLTNAGGIAVLSASGFSLNHEATDLNLAFLAALVSGRPGRLGDFVRQAMVDYDQVPRFTPVGMYGILGDPALLYRAVPRPPPIAPVIAGVRRADNREVTLAFSAQPGQSYSVLATTNLEPPAWSVLHSGIVPFGPFGLCDSGATNFPQRFYRLMTNP